MLERRKEERTGEKETDWNRHYGDRRSDDAKVEKLEKQAFGVEGGAV